MPKSARVHYSSRALWVAAPIGVPARETACGIPSACRVAASDPRYLVVGDLDRVTCGACRRVLRRHAAILASFTRQP